MQHETITPTCARAILAHGWHYQRRLRPNLVRHYAERIRSGNFHQASTITLGYWPGRDDPAIIDGQHRLAAIAQAGIAVETTVLRCDFDSEEEARLAYVETDRGGRRTVYDVVRATPHEGINDTLYALLRSAVNVLVGNQKLMDAELTEACVEWVPDILALQAALPLSLATHRAKELTTGAMIAGLLASRMSLAVALATVRDDRELALSFWPAVVEFNGTNITAATAVGVLMTTTGKNKKDRILAQRRLARCWVAAKDGIDLRMAKAIRTEIAGFEF